MADDWKPNAKTEGQQRMLAHWKGRSIMFCRGNQTEMGCVICAVVGVWPRNPPRISLIQGSSFISKTGYLIADMQKAGDAQLKATVLGHIEQVRDKLRRIADGIKATDAERLEMFDLFKKWHGKDLRATSNLELWKPPKLIN